MELTRHPPGSNGGTRRGPDLKPRNFVPALLLKAYTNEGVVYDPTVPRSQWRKRAKQRHALIENMAQSIQRIGEEAAAGHTKAFGPMLRVLEVTHDVMMPTKGKAKKGDGPRPQTTRFVRAPAGPSLGGSDRQPPEEEPPSRHDRRRALRGGLSDKQHPAW